MAKPIDDTSLRKLTAVLKRLERPTPTRPGQNLKAGGKAETAKKVDGFDMGDSSSESDGEVDESGNNSESLVIKDIVLSPTENNGFAYDSDGSDNEDAPSVIDDENDGFKMSSDSESSSEDVPAAENDKGKGKAPAANKDRFDMDSESESSCSDVPAAEDKSTGHPFADLEGSSSEDSKFGMLVRAVDEIIKMDEPLDSRPWLFDPPDEAVNILVRNICQRYYSIAHPLVGYHQDRKHTDIDMDSYDYPPNFRLPFESHFTKQQLENLHLKVNDAELKNPNYKQHLFAFKGARLNQLDWEMKNVDILGSVKKELDELEKELRALL